MGRVTLVVRLCLLVFTASLAVPSAAVAQHRLCEPAAEDCRQVLIDHIRAEKIGLDVAFWFMEDWWIASEVISRHKAGVPVRVLMDTRANSPNPMNADRLAELQQAGIPMRERVASGILHWKMMLFAGQNIVQFSAANYSPNAWVYSGQPYSNYVDEVILFTSDAALVGSFRTKYDDLWTDTSYYRDYANVVARTRAYDTYPIDPRLNFVPSESHAVRAVELYARETEGIDVVMYRITDSRYADAMIAAVQRGVRVRLLTEPKQYRDPIRQFHSYNVDRMYMAGVEIRHRAHPGLNHQKSVLLHGLGMSVFGSSNWSSASSESQEEHNLFTDESFFFDWLTAQFERKWNNLAPLPESGTFMPLAPDAPGSPAPADGASGLGTATVTLEWYPGLWAHKYDVYLGTDPASLQRVASELPLGPSRSVADVKNFTVTSLQTGTRYFWRIDSKTMANRVASSPVWSFTTAGTAPPVPTFTLVRAPYLQQVTSTSAIVVWATKESGAAHLRITPPVGTSVTVSAVSTLFSAASTGLAADYYQHVAVVSGLTPSTTYTYDILVGGGDLNSMLDTLTTAPASGSGTVSFIAFGDSGTGSTAQRQLAAVMAGDVFDFAMHTGDIAGRYENGHGEATHQTMDDWFFRIYEYLRSKPMFPSLGNHDSREANQHGRPYRDLFVLPTHGATATWPDHAERYYSFDYGPVHVIVLDTELAFQDPARREAQLAWAAADLAATSQPWKIALYHRSPYSAGGQHGSNLAVREAFGALFDQYGVQLSLSSHEHDFERTLPLRAGVPTEGGTVYIVTGGGGAPLYPAGSASWTAFSASVHHYLRGTASECTLRLEAVGLDGVSFDATTLRRCEPPVDVTPPQVSIMRPTNGAEVAGVVNVAVSAIDDVEVDRVELLVNGVVVATDPAAPFSFTWDSTSVPNGPVTLAARATDTAGQSALSTAVTINVQNLALGDGDILLYATDATRITGRWQKEADPTAAGGFKMRNPDAGAPKRITALADPADYFELTFTAVPGVPYRFYMRGKADANYWPNDSVFVQFTGTSSFQIGTTSATEYNLEDCSGCRLSEWGWQDNAWGVGVPSEPIVFTSPGPHTMRIQVREDGLSLDQILLSPVKFFSTWPGQLKNDTTIYPRSTTDPGGPAPDTTAPVVSIDAPASGSTVTGVVTVTVSASDNVAVTQVELLVDHVVVATATASPFVFTWDTTVIPDGDYTLSARAFDQAGNSTVTPGLPVTVVFKDDDPDPDPDPDTEPPSVSVTAPTAGQTVSGVVTVRVTATDNVAVTRAELLVNAVVSGTRTSPPFEFTWNTAALPAGNYALTSRAFDAAGNSSTSIPVVVTIAAAPPPNVPPTVAITSPTANATFVAPASVTVTATAADSDGTIARVDFFAGTTPIGSTTSSPYSVTWSNVAQGTYALTARATDDDGAVTVSSAVGVTVTAPEPPPTGLPAPWAAGDIGAVGAAGSVAVAGNVFSIDGAGADIWNAADGFFYVWQPLSGDADVIARVTSVEYAHAWVKAGVMIRERLTADSAHAMMLVSPGKGLAFQRRAARGGASSSTGGGAGTAPAWVKLERRGNTISAFRSSDGVGWTFVGSDTFAMATDVHVGLAVTSHVYGTLATATFEQVRVVPHTGGPGTPDPNVPPTVTLIAPTSGASFTAPATVPLAATASDGDGTVVRVDFLAGTTLIGSATSAPFEASWSSVPAGTYVVTARAVDDDGAVTVAPAVTVTVAAPPPVLPVEWQSQDVGSVGLTGVAGELDGVFTVTGEGIDIWNAADAFHYVWQPVSGDVDIVARVSYVENVHAWVKAGVMIREQLTADSSHALMLVSPGKGLAFQRRVTRSGSSVHTTGGSGVAPNWVKLERRGHQIRAYRSADGVVWTLVGTETIAMNANVTVGLAVSSHVYNRLATASFDSVTITPR